MPPRSLKSVTASVAFPAFVLGHDPTRRIICVSYSGDLAKKHANDFRAVMEDGWYRELFPGTHIGQKDSESEIELTARGFRLPPRDSRHFVPALVTLGENPRFLFGRPRPPSARSGEDLKPTKRLPLRFVQKLSVRHECLTRSRLSDVRLSTQHHTAAGAV
jgi:hypothetical protein